MWLSTNHVWRKLQFKLLVSFFLDCKDIEARNQNNQFFGPRFSKHFMQKPSSQKILYNDICRWEHSIPIFWIDLSSTMQWWKAHLEMKKILEPWTFTYMGFSIFLKDFRFFDTLSLEPLISVGRFLSHHLNDFRFVRNPSTETTPFVGEVRFDFHSRRFHLFEVSKTVWSQG